MFVNFGENLMLSVFKQMDPHRNCTKLDALASRFLFGSVLELHFPRFGSNHFHGYRAVDELS